MVKLNMMKSAVVAAGVLGGLAFATLPAFADGGRDAQIVQHTVSTQQGCAMISMPDCNRTTQNNS